MKTIYYNGKIYTGELPLKSAFLVENGLYQAVGETEEILKLASDGDQLVNLNGKFVCAGFNDSHMHLLGFGQMLHAIPMSECTDSLEHLISASRDFLEKHPVQSGQWLMGRGWNQDYFCDTDGMPNRFDLDRISEEIPICAIRCCGHCLSVNTKALEILGITSDTQSPEGGKIGMKDGEPDGCFFDNAMQLVYGGIPLPDKETIKDYIRSACKALNTYGVTSSQTDDYCVFRQIPWQLVNEAYRELEEAGELSVRVYEQCNFETIQDLRTFVEDGNMTGIGTELFKIGPLKMLGDGSLGARTAYMTEPYADDPSTKGLPVFSQETFDEMIGYANEKEMQVAVHAIGDQCLDHVLSAMEKALKKNPREDHRHGIVHCQITRPDQLQKIADLKLHVYAQSIFLDYDIHIVEDRVGKERAESSYSWKTLMKKGVSVSNGTDCPVEWPNALAGMQCAITRQTLKDELGPYLSKEAFTVQEALDSYTIRGAEASFEETVKGNIQPGYLADFVVLAEDPFETEYNRIKDIKVCETYLGGNIVYEAID